MSKIHQIPEGIGPNDLLKEAKDGNYRAKDITKCFRQRFGYKNATISRKVAKRLDIPFDQWCFIDLKIPENQSGYLSEFSRKSVRFIFVAFLMSGQIFGLVKQIEA